MRIRADGPVVEWGFGDVWEGPGDVKVIPRRPGEAGAPTCEGCAEAVTR